MGDFTQLEWPWTLGGRSRFCCLSPPPPPLSVDPKLNMISFLAKIVIHVDFRNGIFAYKEGPLYKKLYGLNARGGGSYQLPYLQLLPPQVMLWFKSYFKMHVHKV